jgi:large subunit ribosomal protein L31
MKKTIHPELMPATVICAGCGSSHETRATQPELRVDVCSACHPAYTGEVRRATTGSRVERFERRRRLAVTTS